MAARIARIELRRISAPLVTPYRISRHTYQTFTPLVAEVIDDEGRSGWGEAGITPGLTSEIARGAWAFVRDVAPRLIGREPVAAQRALEASVDANEHAASTLMTSLEQLQASPDLVLAESAAIPLLAPLQAHDEPTLAVEIESKLAEGWRTLKVKVGFDGDHDLRRVRFIQERVGGQGVLRLDANQAFSAADGIRFATSSRPGGIELLEQPCSMYDWTANARVAAVSGVPVMLDEIVHSRADIERAATLPGVRYIKLKLKKMGGAARIKSALQLIGDLGLEPVLGDGSGTDISNWFEARVARTVVRNAGELNGFLKLRRPLLAEPLVSKGGSLILKPGPMPPIDRDWLEQITGERVSSAAGDAARPSVSAA